MIPRLRLFGLTLAVLAVLFSNCGKELSLELYEPPPPPVIPDPPDPEPLTAEDLKNMLIEGRFQLRAFYSDIPVDYNSADSEIKEETDLWEYVIYYLKDDVNLFHAGEVVIEQHESKAPGQSDDTLTRTYLVEENSEGIFMTFLDYQYDPLVYRVHEFGDDYFILSIEWEQGATLFSRFELVP